MNDWIVEQPPFEEDLMNSKYTMLNQNGINKVIEIINGKDKEIERLNKNNIILENKLNMIKKNIETIDKKTILKIIDDYT